MKKKAFVSLLALLTAGSLFLLSACSVDITSINEEEATLSAEIEEHNLISGMLSLHGILYNENGNPLSNATVTFYNGSSVLFAGTTDETGSLPSCSLPCNTILYCTIANGSGSVIAEGNITFKLSDEYSNLIIYPTTEPESEDEIAECTVEIPTTKMDVRGALFVTDGGAVCFASLTPYESAEVSAAATEGNDGEEDEAAPEESETEEEAAEETPAEETAEEEAPAEETAEEETAAEEAAAEEEAPAETEEAAEDTEG